MVDGKVFRGQTATVDIETSGGTTVTVGAMQDVEITVEFEDEKLQGQQIKRVDLMRTGVQINVNASYASFDVDGIKDLLNYDDTGDQLTDSADPPLFTVKVDATSVDGNETLTPHVQDVVFNNISWSWSRDEHVVEDLEGEGKDITNL